MACRLVLARCRSPQAAPRGSGTRTRLRRRHHTAFPTSAALHIHHARNRKSSAASSHPARRTVPREARARRSAWSRRSESLDPRTARTGTHHPREAMPCSFPVSSAMPECRPVHTRTASPPGRSYRPDPGDGRSDLHRSSHRCTRRTDHKPRRTPRGAASVRTPRRSRHHPDSSTPRSEKTRTPRRSRRALRRRHARRTSPSRPVTRHAPRVRSGRSSGSLDPPGTPWPSLHRTPAVQRPWRPRSYWERDHENIGRKHPATRARRTARAVYSLPLATRTRAGRVRATGWCRMPRDQGSRATRRAYLHDCSRRHG